MEIPTGFLIAAALIGLAIALPCFWLGWIAWWAIPLVAAASPFVLFAILGLLLHLAWMADGSH